jgi:hypothetical protein
MTDATPSYTPAPAAAKTNTVAIVALILGILIPIGGIIAGAIALNQIKRTGENGRGLAIAGIVIGAVYIAIVLIFVVITTIIAASAGAVTVSSY